MKLPIFSKLITLILLGSCAVGMQADFVSLSIWERTTTTGEKQHLVCLGDRHDWNFQADEQSDDLISWLKRRSNPHDIVLIEDTYDAKDILVEIKKYCKEHIPGWDESYWQDVKERYHDEFFDRHDGPALLEVALKRTRCGAKNLNVDFRLLERDHWTTCLPRHWRRFLANELHDFVVKQIIKELQGYNDAPFLNSYYQRCIQPFFCMLKELGSVSRQDIVKLLTDCDGTTKILDFLPHQNSLYYRLYCMEYGAKYNFYERRDLAEYLLCELMDARLLHHIYQEHIQKDKANVVVVCAGCAHIWNIETKLDKLGYVQIYSDGASSIDDLKKRIVLSKELSCWLNELSQRELFLQQCERAELVEPVERVELEERKRIELEERIKRRIKHMFLDFDTDMTYPHYSAAKMQAKL